MTDSENEPLDLQAAEKFDHLAGQCWVHQQMSDAASYYRQALAVREDVLGLNHYEVADSLVRLAGVVGWDERESAEPEALWQRAVGIYERLYQEQATAKGELLQHVFMGLLGTLGNLASRAFHRGNVDEAEQAFRRIQAMIEESYGPDCRWVHPTLPTFAKVLIGQGKQEEAERRLRKAIDRTPKAGSIDEWIHPDCQKLLADLYVSQGRNPEAEPLYRQAIELLERASRPIPNLLASALEGLARLCRKTGRGPEADRLEKQAQEARVQV
jgi:tetratricopeptide (TPR) repeat protein